MKLGIIVDSASTMTITSAKKKGWHFIPIIITIDGIDYQDGIDLDDTNFEKLLKITSTFSSSCTPPGPIEKLFKEVSKEYDHVIYYPLSEGLSAQNDNAKSIAKNFKNIHVITSRLMGVLIEQECDYAEELSKKGIDIEEMVSILNKRSQKVMGALIPSSLEWLKKGGRISPATAALGRLLNVKPIITFDGALHKFGKTRSLKKSFFKGVNGVHKKIKSWDNCEIGVIHSVIKGSEYEQKLKEIVEKLEIMLNRKIKTYRFPRILIIHVYFNGMAIMTMPKKKV